MTPALEEIPPSPPLPKSPLRPPLAKGGTGGFVCQRGARPACAKRSACLCSAHRQAAGRGDFTRLAAYVDGTTTDFRQEREV